MHVARLIFAWAVLTASSSASSTDVTRKQSHRASSETQIPVFQPEKGLRFKVKLLMRGTSLFFADLMSWYRLRKSKSSLDYEEHRTVNEFPKLFLRMSPLMVNPLPPPCGIILLAIASTRPRALLCHHFYSETQVCFSAQLI